MYTYKITVFTPVYNRAHLIEGVFESLKKQKFKDFEWLVIDDGSTDNIKEIIDNFKKEADFSIRFYSQKNGGKHRAINKGVKLAKGEWFLIFDSDDKCVESALETFNFYIKKIEKNNKIASIASLIKFENGQIIGSLFPKNEFISNHIDIYCKYKVKGDKWLIFRTDLLKKFPFPEFDGENFIAESSVWDKIGLKYDTLYINKALLIANYLSDGLSNKSVLLRKKNYRGSLYVYKNAIKFDIPIKCKIKAILNYLRFSVFNYYFWKDK